MSTIRKVMVGLVVAVALLLSGGIGSVVANQNGGPSGRPASGMMGGDMDQMRERMAGRMGGQDFGGPAGMGRNMPGGTEMNRTGPGQDADGA